MIQPNGAFQREQSAHGIPRSTALGMFLSVMLFLGILVKTNDLTKSTVMALPVAITTGYFSGRRYKDFMINLLVHPHCLYTEPEKRDQW
jgi:hypothetical protein